jgi:hypothetical protein
VLEATLAALDFCSRVSTSGSVAPHWGQKPIHFGER